MPLTGIVLDQRAAALLFLLPARQKNKWNQRSVVARGPVARHVRASILFMRNVGG